MQGKAHLTFGITTGISTAAFLYDNPRDAVLGFTIGCIVGSLLADIDNPKSIIGSKFKIISSTIMKLFGHRTLFHSPIGVCCFWLLTTTLLNIIPISYNIYATYVISFLITVFVFKSTKGWAFFYKIPICIVTLLLSLIGCQYLTWVKNGITLGLSCHLFLDMFTVGGIPLFFPFSRKRTSLRKVKSGKKIEFLYVIIFAILYIICLYFLNK